MVSASTAFATRLPAAVLAAAQQRVRDAVRAAGLDGLVTDDPEDVAYLTGFFHHPGERPVAVFVGADGTTALLTPELERENAERQHALADAHVSYAEFPGIRSPWAPLAAAIGEGRARLGITQRMTQERLAGLSGQLPTASFAATDAVTRARYVKFDEEIALHREAARITDLMLEAGVALVADAVAAGGELPSESELAAHVGGTGIRTMYAEHDDVIVVSPLAGGLVYTGANSAFPHGLPSGTRLRPGDTFMLSLGCAVGGRFVEGERTFVLGEPSEEQRRYHDAVRDAQAMGNATIAAGVECRAANAACLQVIRDAGLGELLRHREGHGIGLGMHEPPYLEDGDATVLEAGMIVSNEPGIYVRGHAGYRISDSVLVTADGCEPLTAYPRGLTDCTIPV